MIHPIGKRVLVKPEVVKQETASGLIINRNPSPVREGEVVAVGKGVDMTIGDKVLYNVQSGQDVHGYRLLNYDDILGVLE